MDFQSGGSKRDTLSPRQLVILQLIARGYSLRQLAALLATEEAGIHTDILSAIAALRVPSARKAVAEARRRRLIV